MIGLLMSHPLPSLNERLYDPFLTLPADPIVNAASREVLQAAYSWASCQTVSQPQLISYCAEVAEQLGLSDAICQSDDFLAVFSGQQTMSSSRPYAQCYGGHQFGHWAGQLGDGRAINLGAVRDRQQTVQTLQLKGAGTTPYSRGADGRAVLRSSLREYVCSEAMHHLGIATTRSLSLISTGDTVMRDMFYDGHPQAEPGAIICRVAPSFLRFGSYQLCSFRGEIDLLRQLVDFTLIHYFPQLGKPCVEGYIALFDAVCHLTADLIVDWMRVGFVHGVMNTDNLSILGLTIDYGPYGWLDHYDNEWTPNTTDATGKRYRYGQQAYIAQWNLQQLAQAWLPLVNDPEPLVACLQRFEHYYSERFYQMQRSKLGLTSQQPEDKTLFSDLHRLLSATETDMTLFYRCLANISQDIMDDKAALISAIHPAHYDDHLNSHYQRQLVDWLTRYLMRCQQEDSNDRQRQQAMNRVNPKYLFRNYLAQQASEQCQQGDNRLLTELMAVLKRPYDEQPEYEHLAAKRPEWARHKTGCSMLSCSS